MRDDVGVLLVVRGEDPARLRRLLDHLATADGVEDVEVVIAAPAEEHPDLPVTAAGAIGSVRLVDNPSGERSAGLNLALAAASKPFVCRLDARSRPTPDHLRRCVDRLASDAAVGVVGGRQVAVAGGTGSVALGIGRALRNPWVLGGAAYRRVGTAGPVDTVYLGAFRRDDLVAVGGWDEALLANEDYELCGRFHAHGRVIWLEAGLETPYEARADLPALASQYHAFGRSKVEFWRRTGRRPATRQALALSAAAVGGVVVLSTIGQPKRFAALAAVSTVGLAAVDHAADASERDGRVRFHASTASVVLMGAWLSGIVRALLERAGR